MNPEVQKVMIEKVSGAISILSEKLSVGAGHIWYVLTKQGLAEGAADLVYALLALIVLFISYKGLRWCVRKVDEKGEERMDADDAIPLFLLSGTVFLIAGIVMAINLAEGVKLLVNPEYYALQTVLDTIKDVAAGAKH